MTPAVRGTRRAHLLRGRRIATGDYAWYAKIPTVKRNPWARKPNASGAFTICTATYVTGDETIGLVSKRRE